MRASEARFDLIFNNAAVGIAVVDAKGRFTDANDTWLHMIGYTREELEQLGIQDITVPEEPVTNPQKHSGEDQYQQIEKRYRRKDGHEFWGSLCAGAIEDPTGKFIAMVGVIIDITER